MLRYTRGAGSSPYPSSRPRVTPASTRSSSWRIRAASFSAQRGSAQPSKLNRAPQSYSFTSACSFTASKSSSLHPSPQPRSYNHNLRQNAVPPFSSSFSASRGENRFGSGRLPTYFNSKQLPTTLTHKVRWKTGEQGAEFDPKDFDSQYKHQQQVAQNYNVPPPDTELGNALLRQVWKRYKERVEGVYEIDGNFKPIRNNEMNAPTGGFMWMTTGLETHKKYYLKRVAMRKRFRMFLMWYMFLMFLLSQLEPYRPSQSILAIVPYFKAIDRRLENLQLKVRPILMDSMTFWRAASDALYGNEWLWEQVREQTMAFWQFGDSATYENREGPIAMKWHKLSNYLDGEGYLETFWEDPYDFTGPMDLYALCEVYECCIYLVDSNPLISDDECVRVIRPKWVIPTKSIIMLHHTGAENYKTFKDRQMEYFEPLVPSFYGTGAGEQLGGEAGASNLVFIPPEVHYGYWESLRKVANFWEFPFMPKPMRLPEKDPPHPPSFLPRELEDYPTGDMRVTQPPQGLDLMTPYPALPLEPQYILKLQEPPPAHPEAYIWNSYDPESVEPIIDLYTGASFIPYLEQYMPGPQLGLERMFDLRYKLGLPDARAMEEEQPWHRDPLLTPKDLDPVKMRQPDAYENEMMEREGEWEDEPRFFDGIDTTDELRAQSYYYNEEPEPNDYSPVFEHDPFLHDDQIDFPDMRSPWQQLWQPAPLNEDQVHDLLTLTDKGRKAKEHLDFLNKAILPFPEPPMNYIHTYLQYPPPDENWINDLADIHEMVKYQLNPGDYYPHGPQPLPIMLRNAMEWKWVLEKNKLSPRQIQRFQRLARLGQQFGYYSVPGPINVLLPNISDDELPNYLFPTIHPDEFYQKDDGFFKRKPELAAPIEPKPRSSNARLFFQEILDGIDDPQPIDQPMYSDPIEKAMDMANRLSHSTSTLFVPELQEVEGAYFDKHVLWNPQSNDPQWHTHDPLAAPFRFDPDDYDIATLDDNFRNKRVQGPWIGHYVPAFEPTLQERMDWINLTKDSVLNGGPDPMRDHPYAFRNTPLS